MRLITYVVVRTTSTQKILGAERIKAGIAQFQQVDNVFLLQYSFVEEYLYMMIGA